MKTSSKERKSNSYVISELKRRVKELEELTKNEYKEVYREIVSIIRINQEIVSELVKANDALRIEISRLPSKIEELVERLDELLSLIKTASEQEIQTVPIEKRIDELVRINKRIEDVNQLLLDSIEKLNKTLKALAPTRTTKPLIEKKPTL